MKSCGLVTLTLTVLLSLFCEQSQGIKKTICQGASTTLACKKQNNVINIKIATYGRLKKKICRSKKDRNDENTKCWKANNALSIIKKTCNNKTKCKIRVLKRLFKGLCSGDSAYLDVRYTCKKGCSKGEFRCLKNRKCIIAKNKVCDDVKNSKDGSDELNCPSNVQNIINTQCGVKPITPFRPTQSRIKRNIVGGSQANPNFWPWAIQLRVNAQGDGNYVHQCGAALISPSFALTASHCFIFVSDTTKWQAIAGRHNKFGTEPNNQIRKISKIIPFPNPTGNVLDRDTTLIKFDKPMEINRYVTPVCLPTKEPKVGDSCTVVGWGDTKGTGNDGTLKQTYMPIVDRKTCNKTEGLVGLITPYMICSGWEQGKHDACQGDSGGPFVCKYGSTYYLQGLVSWGNDCAKPNQPGVYGNVFKVVSWVKEQISKN